MVRGRTPRAISQAADYSARAGEGGGSLGNVLIPDFSERGCVEDQPQQFHFADIVKKTEPALVCEGAAAGALIPHTAALRRNQATTEVQAAGLFSPIVAGNVRFKVESWPSLRLAEIRRTW